MVGKIGGMHQKTRLLDPTSSENDVFFFPEWRVLYYLGHGCIYWVVRLISPKTAVAFTRRVDYYLGHEVWKSGNVLI